MNNRQLKKLRAHRHNVARAEIAAYQEDRIRQPEKYMADRDLAAERRAKIILATMSAFAANSGGNEWVISRRNNLRTKG